VGKKRKEKLGGSAPKHHINFDPKEGYMAVLKRM
jgi:hypothetical protein